MCVCVCGVCPVCVCVCVCVTSVTARLRGLTPRSCQKVFKWETCWSPDSFLYAEKQPLSTNPPLYFIRLEFLVEGWKRLYTFCWEANFKKGGGFIVKQTDEKLTQNPGCSRREFSNCCKNGNYRNRFMLNLDLEEKVITIQRSKC